MKIFLSSTYQDLVTHRAKAAEAIERLGQHGIRMEVFGARPGETTAVCLSEIDSADAFVGIYAHRYGYIPEGSETSITEQEFDFAQQKAKPMFCFLVDENYEWLPANIEREPGKTKLSEFKQKVSKSVIRDTFTKPEDLAFKLSSSLGHYLLTLKINEGLDHVHRIENLSFFEGIWKSTSNGSTYCCKIINNQLYLPYCWEGDGSLTGHHFNCVLVSETLFTRFKWFHGDLAGNAFFVAISQNELVNGWILSRNVPNILRYTDIPLIDESMPGIEKHILKREGGYKDFPYWAQTYFVKIEHKSNSI